MQAFHELLHDILDRPEHVLKKEKVNEKKKNFDYYINNCVWLK